MFYKCHFKISDDETIAQWILNITSPSSMLVSVEQIVACFVFNVRPLVDVFGMVGNILCIAICLSPRLRRAPTTLHLTALAVYDLLFFLGEIPATFDGSGAASAAVVMRSKVGCWTVVYSHFVSSCLSAWTVTAFTVERFIVVYFPLHRAAVCTFKNTIIILLCLIPIPLIFHSYVFFLYPNRTGICYFKEEHNILRNWLNLIDFVIANLIPLIAIFTLNGLIAIRMRKNDQERREHPDFRLHHSAAASTSSMSLTRSLIIVSTTFAVLNVPIYVMNFRVIYLNAFGSIEEDWTDFDQVFWLIAILLFHTNFAADFVLYNLSSVTFRKVALDLLVPKRLKQVRSYQTIPLHSSPSNRYIKTTKL